MTNKNYSISELSSEFGVTPRTLRYYEDKNLISPERKGQTRLYSAADRARLDWILRGKRVGYSLDELSQVLDIFYQDNGRAKQGKTTLEALEKRISELNKQKQDIDETISELEDLKIKVQKWMSKRPQQEK